MIERSTEFIILKRYVRYDVQQKCDSMYVYKLLW